MQWTCSINIFKKSFLLQEQCAHLEVHNKLDLVAENYVKFSKFYSGYLSYESKTEESHLPASSSASSVRGSVPSDPVIEVSHTTKQSLPCNWALISVIRSNASCERVVQSSASSTTLTSITENQIKNFSNNSLTLNSQWKSLLRQRPMRGEPWSLRQH